jgi:branched-chain amino acid aminotransferase
MYLDGVASVNGVLHELSDAVLSVDDRGLMYGQAVFETMVGFGTQVLDVEAHLGRLRDSCEFAEITLDVDDTQISKELMDAVHATSHIAKKNIRLTVTAGTQSGLRSVPLSHNRMITIRAAKIDPAQNQGIMLHTRRRQTPAGGAKLCFYLPEIMALKNLDSNADVLWVNPAGEVTEASTANIFLLGRQGDFLEIATPHEDCGLLAGITRQKMIDLCTLAKIPVTARRIELSEIPRFDEAFICSSVRGLVPVERIDQHRLHTSRSTASYWHLRRLFLASVERDLGRKVDWDTGTEMEAPASFDKREMN